MLGAFWVAIDRYAKSLVKYVVVAIPIAQAWAFRISRFRVEQENICACKLGKGINMIKDIGLDAILRVINDQVGVNIDNSTSLFHSESVTGNRQDKWSASLPMQSGSR